MVTRPYIAPHVSSGEGLFARGRLYHLVQAATVADAPVEAWMDYTQALGSRPPNIGEIRLFPQVAHRIGPQEIAAHRLDRLARALRQAKVMHQLFVTRHRAALTTLSRIAPRPILMKGAALQSVAYAHPWLRMASDVDAFVPRPQAYAAFEALSDDGWKALDLPYRADGVARHIPVDTSLPMTHDNGGALDLHWVPRSVLQFSGALTEDFSVTARPVTTDFGEYYVPSATWLLFETLEHGMKRNDVYPVRWIIDAHLLLAAQGALIDWDRFGEITDQARCTAVVAAAFGALEEAGVPLPDQARDRWHAAAPAALERIEMHVRIKPWPAFVRSLAVTAPHFFLRAPGAMPAKLLRFPGYFKSRIAGTGNWARFFSLFGSRLRRLLPGRAR
ncbi:MAG: nucleotidyltransferase family protein [Pseudomonadota bacterium]